LNALVLDLGTGIGIHFKRSKQLASAWRFSMRRECVVRVQWWCSFRN